MLNGVGWRVATDVSGRNNLTLDDWTDILSRNVSRKLRTYAVQHPQRSKTIIIGGFFFFGFQVSGVYNCDGRKAQQVG